MRQTLELDVKHFPFNINRGFIRNHHSLTYRMNEQSLKVLKPPGIEKLFIQAVYFLFETVICFTPTFEVPISETRNR